MRKNLLITLGTLAVFSTLIVAGMAGIDVDVAGTWSVTAIQENFDVEMPQGAMEIACVFEGSMNLMQAGSDVSGSIFLESEENEFNGLCAPSIQMNLEGEINGSDISFLVTPGFSNLSQSLGSDPAPALEVIGLGFLGTVDMDGRTMSGSWGIPLIDVGGAGLSPAGPRAFANVFGPFNANRQIQEPIPTLSEWGIGILAGLILLGGLALLGRMG